MLPIADWSTFYRTKNKTRVKSQKLRGVWSVGIVEKLERLGLAADLEVGTDVSERLGIFYYEAPCRHNLNAKGSLPFGIFKTDEWNYQKIENLPFGEEVIITTKMDGSNINFYCKLQDGEVYTGITSRSLNLK